MQTLKSLLDQSLLIWKDSTAAARFGLTLLVILCVGGIAGIGIWSARPNYIMLASELDPAKSAVIMDALDADNISFEVKGAGSIILVDKRQWSRAQLIAGKNGIRQNGPELEDIGIWPNPDVQRNIERRNLEAQLIHSIQSMPAIALAKVHLNMPKPEPFIRRTADPSASVLLEITPGMRFDDSQAATIAGTIAYAVPNLTVERVSIADTDGNKYSIDDSLGGLSNQEEHRLNRERDAAQKVQTMLAGILGYGNSIVSVTADYSFPDGSTESTEYDPDKTVLIEEIVRNISATDPTNGPASGSPGTSSNVGNAAGDSGSQSTVLSNTEDLTSKFAVSETTRKETNKSPILNQLSVSVQINLASISEEIDSPEFRQSIQTSIQNAVGFRESKDEISVEFLTFAPVVVPEPPAAFALPWDQINQLVKNLSLGVAAIIALLVARNAFKRIQPEPSASVEVSNRASQVNQLSELVKQNPEVFSQIISSWSNLDSDEKTSSSQIKKAA